MSKNIIEVRVGAKNYKFKEAPEVWELYKRITFQPRNHPYFIQIKRGGTFQVKMTGEMLFEFLGAVFSNYHMRKNNAEPSKS